MGTKHVYLSVMGTLGSGKTTAARLIADTFKFHLVEENFGDNAFLPRFYQDMKRWAFHSQTFYLMEKITQMLETAQLFGLHTPDVKEVRTSGVNKVKGVIQDTPILQDVFSYAKAQHVLGNMDDAEWRLYLNIYRSFESQLIKPDFIIYLETSVPVIMERVKKRGRSYEQQIPQSYLELLDMLNHKWLSENKTIPVLTIATDGLNIVSSRKAQELLAAQVHGYFKEQSLV